MIDDDEEEEEEEPVPEVEAPKPVPKRDARLATTDQVRFTYTHADLKKLLGDDQSASNKLLDKDTGLEDKHGLAGGSAVKSERKDPLKDALEKVHMGGEHAKPTHATAPKGQPDRLAEIYGQYMSIDASDKAKKKPKN